MFDLCREERFLSSLWLCLASWVAGALLISSEFISFSCQSVHTAIVPKLYRGLRAIIVDSLQWKRVGHFPAFWSLCALPDIVVVIRSGLPETAERRQLVLSLDIYSKTHSGITVIR